MLILASGQQACSQEEQSVQNRDFSKMVTAERNAGIRQLSFRASQRTTDYDLKYHRLVWEVDPGVSYIKGEVTSYFVPKADNFTQINFDLAANMQVNQVRYQGSSLPFELSEEDNLNIQLPVVLPAGRLDSITVYYEGSPESNGLGAFELDTHDGTPVLWTLSEPYGAKIWWPCKQDLNDKIDSVDIIVSTPSAYRVASNGVLQSETVNGGLKTYHWKHRYPIPAYLIAIAVTNYAVFSDFVQLAGRELEILNYVYPESQQRAEEQLSSTVEMMELFGNLFGEYPFADEKYGHAEFGFGGGMEHQTMSFMGSYSYSLQAHELAHQWFGNKITCGSWRDIWLNEGFATYLTGLTYEFLDAPGDWSLWKRGLIDNITSVSFGSVRVDDTTSVSRIFNGRLSYQKGAMLLHMLRWKLGDEAFFRGVRNYLEDPDLAYSYAKTEDLQAHLEEAGGQSLDAFFMDWFYGEGYPSYQVQWVPLGDTLRIKLGQTTSSTTVGFFEMPVQLQASGLGIDTLLRFDHSFDGQIMDFVLPGTVNELVFDPNSWIVSADNSIEQVDELDKPISITRSFMNALRIGPNPTTQQLKIELEESQHSIRRMDLIDSGGKLIRSYLPTINPFYIEVEDLRKGVYYLKFTTSELQKSFPIIKID